MEVESRQGGHALNWFMDIVGHWPDGGILVAGAVTTSVLAIAIAFLSRHVFFPADSEALAVHGKLAEIVHSSLLAFAVFVLALVLSDARANMSKADDAVMREASALERLDWELEQIGTLDATDVRKQLRTYASSVVKFDWPELGKATPALSKEATRALATLVVSVRALAATKPDMAQALTALTDKLHDFRQERLAGATRAVPPIFWWLIGAFLIGAMVLNGRHKLDLASVSLIALHMSAIGLVIAFILIMDEPFRGDATVLPHPIANMFSALAAL